MKELILTSMISCPVCNHCQEEAMPVDACQWFYQCKCCGKLLTPKKGDCCVFCSYGTVSCPPVQQGGGTCCSP
ncbi:GDCCVxC domain-containing (seleno)protein [Microbulbifer echini]|uniref:GDCCVxC domain-containing (Seleno)protein n=1 Tax=Microbulbifer echini TaxID=1529067 RepID=A0ABV4NTB4_9GAMM